MPGIRKGMDMESKGRKPSDNIVASPEQDRPATPQSPARTARHARADGGGGGVAEDAPPSNTASYKCKPPYFQALRWGIDSLYLNYQGSVFPVVDIRLATLKKLAQSPDAYDQSSAQYLAGGQLFEVKDKAPKGFAYVLEDGSFRIQISRSSKLPCAYVKISSAYLAHVGPAKAEEAARKVVDELIEVRDAANVSRIDLFVDFASSENMEWDRNAWVTRAHDVDRYSEKGVFTGWVVGKGGVISARLYHKLLQAAKIGAGYLLELWEKAGWDGVTDVWRLEFQLRRELLSQHGVLNLSAVLEHLNSLWSYATTEWLRLTLPSEEDKTRSRWPLHPLWGYLSSIDWETNGGPLSRTYSPARVPGDDWIYTHALSVLISFMARERITDLYEGNEALLAGMYLYHGKKAARLETLFDDYIDTKLALKGRLFNTLLNDPRLPEKLDEEALQEQIRGYRQGSKGGV